MDSIRLVYDLREELERVGVDMLTGEACGLSMRLLCDLTPAAVELVSEFTGGAVPQSPPWNGGAASIMLTRTALLDLLIFALCREGFAVCKINASASHKINAELVVLRVDDEFQDNLDRVRKYSDFRLYMAEGTAGTRNRHQVSGRVE